MKKYIRLFCSITFGVIVINCTFSQKNKSISATANDDFAKEMEVYRQNKILPVIYTQRTKLDDFITVNDKKEIDYLRNFLSKYRKNKDVVASKKRIKGLSAIKNIFTNHTDELEIAVRLVEKYHDNVLNLNDQIKLNIEKWEAEKSRICQKYGVDYRPTKIKKSFWKVLGFILLDPDNTYQERLDQQAISIKTQENFNLKVFPNPASSTQTLNFLVPENGNIKIDLIDIDGRIIKTLYNDFIDKGDQSLTFDIKSIPTGDYYYRYQFDNKIETIKTCINLK